MTYYNVDFWSDTCGVVFGCCYCCADLTVVASNMCGVVVCCCYYCFRLLLLLHSAHVVVVVVCCCYYCCSFRLLLLLHSAHVVVLVVCCCYCCCCFRLLLLHSIRCVGVLIFPRPRLSFESVPDWDHSIFFIPFSRKQNKTGLRRTLFRFPKKSCKFIKKVFRRFTEIDQWDARILWILNCCNFKAKIIQLTSSSRFGCIF